MEGVPVDPPRFGLGYWLAVDVTGCGVATAAVWALLEHAPAGLGATDVFAGDGGQCAQRGAAGTPRLRRGRGSGAVPAVPPPLG